MRLAFSSRAPHGCGDFGVPSGRGGFSRRSDLASCSDGRQDVLMPDMPHRTWRFDRLTQTAIEQY